MPNSNPEPTKPNDVSLPIAAVDASTERAVEQSIYQQLGAEKFWDIARAFYGRVDKHERMRPIFPADLQEPIRNQAEFLIQYLVARKHTAIARDIRVCVCATRRFQLT